MICALRGEQAQHQQPDAPRRGTKLLQQGREDFVPGDDSFFLFFSFLLLSKGEEERCTVRRLHCTDAKESANPLLRAFAPAQGNPTSQFPTKTQEKSAQSTPLAGKPAPSLPSKILQRRGFPQILGVAKLEIKDRGSLKDNHIKSWVAALVIMAKPELKLCTG